MKPRPAKNLPPQRNSVKARSKNQAGTPAPSLRQSNQVGSLQDDLNQLKAMAFHRDACCGEEIRRFYKLKKASPDSIATLDILRRWMLCPITLWPVNFHHLLTQALDQIEAGKTLDEDFHFLIAGMQEPPPEDVRERMQAFEFAVAAGSYESLIPASTKFESIDQEAALNPELEAEWKTIATHWRPERFADSKGFLRRTPVVERNLRPDFSADWTSEESRFQTVFDLFCARWNLYGMHRNKPVVLKLSVNPTAYGTMIFIPSYWSLDSMRDFDWKEITKLHRVRSMRKQGAALAEGKADRRRLANILRKAEAEAKALGLKGHRKNEFLFKALGWVPETDPKRLSRLKKEFPVDA